MVWSEGHRNKRGLIEKNRFHYLYTPALYLLLIAILYIRILPDFHTAMPSSGMRYAPLFLSQRGAEKLIKGGNPLYFEEIYYPTGVQLFGGILPALFFSIVGIFFNPITVQNLSIVLSLFLSALGMHLLVYYITRDRPASFMAGLYYSLSPFHLRYLPAYSLFPMEWFPFFILMLLKMKDTGKVMHAILAGILMSFLALTHWYYGVFGCFIFGLFILYHLKSLKSLIPKLLLSLAVFAIITLPFAVPLIKNIPMVRAGTSLSYETRSGADLLSFFIPPANKLLFIGGIFRYPENSVTYILSERMGTFLSFTFITFAIIGLTLKLPFKKHTNFFILLGGISFILALGPKLKVSGVITNITLPYYFLYHALPLPFRFTRQVRRYALMTILSTGVVASSGFAGARKMFPKRKTLLTFLGFAGLIFELSPSPFSPIKPVTVPTFYLNLDNSPEDFTIVELPLYRHNGYILLYYNMHHHKKVMGGAGDRAHYIFSRYIGKYPFLHQLRYFLEKFNPKKAFYHHDIIDFSCRETSLSIAKLFKIKYIVLHKYELIALSSHKYISEPSYRNYTEFLLNCGWKIYYEDSTLSVFTPPEGRTVPVIVIGDNWSNPQPINKTTPIRWARKKATFQIFTETESSVILSFTIKSASTSLLNISLNGKILSTKKVYPALQTFALQMKLKKGINILAFENLTEFPYGISRIKISKIDS